MNKRSLKASKTRLILLSLITVCLSATALLTAMLFGKLPTNLLPQAAKKAQLGPPFKGMPAAQVQKLSQNWTLTKHDNLTPATNWSPLNEADVFHTRLVHKEKGYNDWEIEPTHAG